VSVSRILIVDDNPVNLKLLRVTLQRDGHALATATSAEDALAAVELDPPDLILLDIQLPRMTGLEMARHLKSDPNTAGIRIVAVTAFASPIEEQAAYEAGCDCFVRKPIDTRTLGSLVIACLSGVARYG
jgi:CheY-like chemotaxis protein